MVGKIKKQDSRKKILFYSSVKTKRMFSIQKFYRTDIDILRKLGYDVSLSNSIFDFFRFKKYDIAFIYFYRYGLLAAMVSKLFRKKVLFTGGIDYLDREYAGFKAYYVQKFFFILCQFFGDKIILVSNADKNNIQKFFKRLPESKFPLSFHVIDFDLYRYSFNGDRKQKILTTIAWMIREENIYRKGVDKSVKVFKELVKLDPEFKMLIIGPKGDGSKIVEKLIEKYDLRNKVILTDSISEDRKIKILKESKYYLQLSSYEGFGIAAIEALASGNIVLHSGRGGLQDGVNKYGVVASNLHDYKQIAEEIIRFEEENKNDLLISRGISHVENNFTFDKRLKDFKDILHTI